MPKGKPAGVPCIHLLDDYRCAIFALAERPAFCSSLKASEEMCGTERRDAMVWLLKLEQDTAPEDPFNQDLQAQR